MEVFPRGEEHHGKTCPEEIRTYEVENTKEDTRNPFCNIILLVIALPFALFSLLAGKLGLFKKMIDYKGYLI